VYGSRASMARLSMESIATRATFPPRRAYPC
jgi:hypothetical protein